LVRDDTVSVPLLVQVPAPEGAAVPFIVSFPLVISDWRCAARPGLGTCNTNCPVAAGTGGPDRGAVTSEGPFRCCCAPTRRSRPRTWRPARWPARRATPGSCARWGHGRDRLIGLHGGARRRVRPRRGRCGSCRATHVLLPSWMAPRRADAVGVIARAAVAPALHGTGSGRLRGRRQLKERHRGRRVRLSRGVRDLRPCRRSGPPARLPVVPKGGCEHVQQAPGTWRSSARPVLVHRSFDSLKGMLLPGQASGQGGNAADA
jgi:hypothetical protein